MLPVVTHTPFTTDTKTDAEARIGLTLLGKWRLDALLGCGGMGAVYAATHRNGSRGAIKILHSTHAHDPNIQNRFRREGLIANTVAHPGVVSVIDDDVTDEGDAFLVMELLEGTSLSDRGAQAGGTLPIAEVLRMADRVLDVLAVAHEHGVLHRDIKPDNIFVTCDGDVKILDFGIAHLSPVLPSAKARQAHTTTGGQPMGTPAFMSPEQARGRWSHVDARSDVWSVGATMFWLLTARPPHDEETLQEQLAALITRQAPSLHDVRGSIPSSVVAVVDRALRLEQDERWPDARSMQLAVRDAARQLVGCEMRAPRPVSTSVHPVVCTPAFVARPRRRDPRMLGMAATIIGAAALAGASLALSSFGRPAHASVTVLSTQLARHDVAAMRDNAADSLRSRMLGADAVTGTVVARGESFPAIRSAKALAGHLAAGIPIPPAPPPMVRLSVNTTENVVDASKTSAKSLFDRRF